MSSISPISVRIASKTRFFEATGDSSYYYSSQLLSNMALLKAVTKLGQQLAWPSKALDRVPKAKVGSAFLTKASQSVVNSRIEPLINLKATPGKEWISANLKLVSKLTTSQQFFNSKAIGFLAKGLGRSGKLDSFPYGALHTVQSQQIRSCREATTANLRKIQTCEQVRKLGGVYERLRADLTSANFFPAQLANQRASSGKFALLRSQTFERSEKAWATFPLRGKANATGSLLPAANIGDLIGCGYSPQFANEISAPGPKLFPVGDKFQSQSLIASQERVDSGNNKLLLKENSWFTSFNYLTQLAKYCNSRYYKQPLSRSASFTKNKKSNSRSRGSTTPYKAQNRSLQKTSIIKELRKDSSQAFKTTIGLSFYLTALGLVGHSQVLRSSLVIAPIVSGSLQSNLLLADHKKVIKVASSNGIGLVSTSPKCYISRSTKDTVLNFFYKIPAKLAEKRVNNHPQYHQVYVLADLQGLRKPQKRLKQTYASARWL